MTGSLEIAMLSSLTEAARKLSISERILLVEEIWNSIADDNVCFDLTEAQKQELDRRLASFHADPSQGRTWEEIKLIEESK
jgi:putative addiction module component (TIGR02574 family)